MVEIRIIQEVSVLILERLPVEQIAFEGEIFRTQTEPGYFYHLYRSNINKFNWNNSLVKIKNIRIQGKSGCLWIQCIFQFL